MHNKFYNNECVIICFWYIDDLVFWTNIDVVHEARLFHIDIFDMKDIVKLMSCWTLKLLEIMIALFYLIHIIWKDA